MRAVKIRIESVVKEMLCFALFLSFGSVFAVFFPYQIEMLIMLLTFAVMIISKNYIIRVELLKVVVISYVILIASMFLTNSSFADYQILFVRIPLTLLIVTAFGNDYKEIAKYIVFTLWLIMFLALVNFILTMIIPSLFYLVELEDGYRTLTVGYIFNMLAEQSIMGIELVRNQSIFWEPGILQIVANILVYYIIIDQNKPISQALLPVFIILTTVSTTGFIILGFLLFVKFKSGFSLKGKGLARTLVMILVIGAFIPILYGEIVHKFTGEAKTSSTLRMFDLYMGMSVAFNHPITGIGMNVEKMIEMTGSNTIQIAGEDLQSDRGNTNSIILILVKLGFPVTIIALWGMYKQTLFDQRFCFFVVLFLSLSSEPLYTSYIVLILIMSSIKIHLRNGTS